MQRRPLSRAQACARRSQPACAGARRLASWHCAPWLCTMMRLSVWAAGGQRRWQHGGQQLLTQATKRERKVCEGRDNKCSERGATQATSGTPYGVLRKSHFWTQSVAPVPREGRVMQAFTDFHRHTAVRPSAPRLLARAIRRACRLARGCVVLSTTGRNGCHERVTGGRGGGTGPCLWGFLELIPRREYITLSSECHSPTCTLGRPVPTRRRTWVPPPGPPPLRASRLPDSEATQGCSTTDSSLRVAGVR